MTLRVGLVPQDERGPEKGKKASAAICDNSSCYHHIRAGWKNLYCDEAGSIFPKSASLCEGLGQSHSTDRYMALALEGGVHSKWIIVKGPLWGRKVYALLRQVRGAGDGWPACWPPWNAVFNLTRIV